MAQSSSYPGICLELLMKTMENFSHNRRWPAEQKSRESLPEEPVR
jgi:hypothetical protein